MKHGIRPKTYLKDKYPDVINKWDTHGLIEVLVVDNAKHWHGKDLEDACYQMGTDIQYAPVRVPWYKGAVERLLKTIHQELIHKQPGTTFSNIFDKGDYDSTKHAVIRLDLLDEILHKWIVDVYSQRSHYGIKGISPAKRWMDSIVKNPPALPPAHTNLDIILGKIEHRKLSGTVIRFKNLDYSDIALAALKTNQRKNEEIKIKYNPTDLGVIYVYDAFWSRFIPVPAVDQEYAKGLTEWQHEVICKFIRRTNESQINRKALAEAKEYIRQKIAAELGRKPKKLKSVGKIAKWMAFEDPAEAIIVCPSGNEKQETVKVPDDFSTSSGSRSLKGKNKFSQSTDETNISLNLSDDKNWDVYFSSAQEEEL